MEWPMRSPPGTTSVWAQSAGASCPTRSGRKNRNITCEGTMSGSVDYLPLFHDVRGVNVLVVGGGTVATRKVETLLAREAIVTVVATEFSRPIVDWTRRGEIRAIEGRF